MLPGRLGDASRWSRSLPGGSPHAWPGRVRVGSRSGRLPSVRPGAGNVLAVRVEDERHHHPLMKVPALPMEQAITFARDVPRARIVLCTATTPEVTAFLQGVSGDQAYAEISYIKSPLNAIEDLVGHVGHERLVFGSHAPFAYAHTALAKVKEAYISDEQKAAILGGNAARVLGE